MGRLGDLGPPARSTQLVQGTCVEPVPLSVDDPLFVNITSFGGESHTWGPVPYTAHGDIVPVVGDAVLLAIDETGSPWVVMWGVEAGGAGVQSGTTIVVEGGGSGGGPVTVGPTILLEYERPATDFQCCAPINKTFMSGVFTPTTSSVIIDIDVCGSFEEGSTGHAGVILLVGPSSLSPLNTETTIGSIPAGSLLIKPGSTGYNMGGIASYPGQVHFRKLLTGLTPGVEIAWEVAAGTVGFANLLALSETPTSVSCSKATPGALGDVIVAMAGPTTLQVIRSNHQAFPPQDVLLGAVALPGASQPRFCQVADDGKRIVVSNQTSNTVTVVSALPTPTILGTYALPGGVTGPNRIAIEPAAANAYVCCASGKVQAVAVATGVMGLTFLTGDTAAEGDISLDATGSVMFFCGRNSSKLYAYFTASTTLFTSFTLGAAGVQLCALSGDGLTLYVVGGTSIYSISLLTLVVSATVIAMAATIQPTAMQGFSDSQALLISSSETGTAGRQLYVYSTPSMILNQIMPNPLASQALQDFAISPCGSMFMPYTLQMVQYYGGKFYLRGTAGGGWGERASLRFERA